MSNHGPYSDCVRVCEGPVQSKLPQERSGWVRLSGTSLCLKRLVSSQPIAGRGAECRVRQRFRGHTHHPCAITMEQSALFCRFG